MSERDYETDQDDQDDESQVAPGEGEERTGRTVPGTPDGQGDSDDDAGDDADSDADDAAADGDDEYRRAKIEARRKERQTRRERRREKEQSYVRQISSLQLQLQEAQNRLYGLEQRSANSQLAQLDNAINEAAEASTFWKSRLSEAAQDSDGAALAEAQENYYTARKRYDDLANYKQQIVYNSQKQSQQPAPVDPVVMRNMREWTTRNQWYDPACRDEDSRAAREIDNALGSEGWDPRTIEYWEELDERVKRRLPHKFAAAKPATTAKRGVPVSGGGREVSGGHNGSYTLSPERVAMLKEAGMWDNPEERAKMIKRYQQYDKDSKGGSQ